MGEDRTKSVTRRVTLFTRRDCCLCDQAKAVLAEVRGRVAFELDVVDVDTDPALVREYGQDVPVILIDGKKAFKHRVDRRGLEERLLGRGIFARIFGLAGRGDPLPS